jgi:hypothetical protein
MIGYQLEIFFSGSEKYSITTETLMGVSPPPLWLPLYDNPQTGTTSSSLSAGAVWGDRHCPLLHRTPALYFIVKGKGILKSRFPISLLLSGKVKSKDCREQH